MTSIHRRESQLYNDPFRTYPSRPRISFPRHPRLEGRQDQWFVRKRIGKPSQHPIAKIVMACSKRIFLPDTGRPSPHLSFLNHRMHVRDQYACKTISFRRVRIGESYQYSADLLLHMLKISNVKTDMPQDLIEEEYINLFREIIQNARLSDVHSCMQKFVDYGYYKKVPRAEKLNETADYSALSEFFADLLDDLSDPSLSNAQIEKAIDKIVQEKSLPTTLFGALSRVELIEAFNERCLHKKDRFRFVEQIFYSDNLSKIILAGPLFGIADDNICFDPSLKNYLPNSWNSHVQLYERVVLNKMIREATFLSDNERKAVAKLYQEKENRVTLTFDKFLDTFNLAPRSFSALFFNSNLVSVEYAEQAMEYAIFCRSREFISSILSFHERATIFYSQVLYDYFPNDLIALVKDYAIYTRIEYAKWMLPSTNQGRKNRALLKSPPFPEFEASFMLGVPEKLDDIISTKFQNIGNMKEYCMHGKFLMEEEIVVAAMSSRQLTAKQKDQFLLDFNEARRNSGRHMLPLQSHKGELYEAV